VVRISDVALPQPPPEAGDVNPAPTTQPTAEFMKAALLTRLSGTLSLGDSVVPPLLATIKATPPQPSGGVQPRNTAVLGETTL
jgi:hypothetical protein